MKILNRSVIIIISLLLISYYSNAQGGFSIPSYNSELSNINKSGMKILGTWSVGNIALNGALLSTGNASGEEVYFYRMNMAWNTVNLGLAVFSFLDANKEKVGTKDLGQTVRDQNRFEKLFLVNTALDVAYIVSGFYLMEAGNNPEKNQDQLRGFGKGLVLQGSFLFLFDLTMFAIHNKHGKKLNNVLNGISLSYNSVGLRYYF